MADSFLKILMGATLKWLMGAFCATRIFLDRIGNLRLDKFFLSGKIRTKENTMNRFELFNAMLNRDFISIGNHVGTIQAIEMEDGSGHCFNVTLLVGTRNIKLFVRG
jgi:hypothetical protein